MTDRLFLGVLERGVRKGRLTVTLADGSRTELTGTETGPEADLALYASGRLPGILAGGALGLLEAYMDRLIDTNDLAALLLFAAENQTAWIEAHPRLYAAGRAATRLRRTRGSAVETMAGHYNLGNDFYSRWLDDTMTYSSARFSLLDGDQGTDLRSAQVAKYDRLADLAAIEPGHSVLEIGTGWGGFALHLARRGCRVTTVTIAEEQLAYVKDRLTDQELPGSVDAHLADFSEIEGTFDRVVSVEMIESIDERRWPELFDTIARVLTPGGVMGMQAIVIDDDLWDSYHTNPDFIQRYIFPGGMLPTPSLLQELTARVGLTWGVSEPFGLDYARTLRIWHERFERAWPEISRHGFDERFRRMWKAYLAYCEAGFTTGRIDVQQFTATRS